MREIVAKDRTKAAMPPFQQKNLSVERRKSKVESLADGFFDLRPSTFDLQPTASGGRVNQERPHCQEREGATGFHG
jgi:hypothetical protein